MFSEEVYIKYSREIFLYLNSDNYICKVSDNFYKALEYEQIEVIGKHIDFFISQGEFTEKSNEYSDEIVLNDKNLNKRYFSIKVNKEFDDNGNFIGTYIGMFEITKYKKIENEYNILKHVCDKSTDIIYKKELHPQRKFTYINDAVQNILGVTKEEHYNNPNIPFELIHPDDYIKIHNRVNDRGEFKKALELRYKNIDGQYLWLEDFCIPTYDENKRLIAVQGISRCIQDRKELERDLEYLSYNDILTGLKNRAYFRNKISTINNKVIGIIILDLDNLKQTNDKFGHLIGDKLIIETANILKEVFDRNGMIARMGGDEFVIALIDVDEEHIKKKIRYLEERIKIYNNESEIKISISKGFSLYKDFKQKIDSVIQEADYNMYKDKNSKKY